MNWVYQYIKLLNHLSKEELEELFDIITSS